METFTAIALGIAGGLIGIVPFFVARSKIKKRLKTDGVGSIIAGMAATMISFFIMIAEIVICNIFFKEHLLSFAISAIVVFLLAMGVYTATLMRR